MRVRTLIKEVAEKFIAVKAAEKLASVIEGGAVNASENTQEEGGEGKVYRLNARWSKSEGNNKEEGGKTETSD